MLLRGMEDHEYNDPTVSVIPGLFFFIYLLFQCDIIIFANMKERMINGG